MLERAFGAADARCDVEVVDAAPSFGRGAPCALPVVDAAALRLVRKVREALARRWASAETPDMVEMLARVTMPAEARSPAPAALAIPARVTMLEVIRNPAVTEEPIVALAFGAADALGRVDAEAATLNRNALAAVERVGALEDDWT